jgi:hypothetical protein
MPADGTVWRRGLAAGFGGTVWRRRREGRQEAPATFYGFNANSPLKNSKQQLL